MWLICQKPLHKKVVFIYKGDGGRYLVRDKRRKAPQSIYGFGAGYTLVDNPRTWVEGLSTDDGTTLAGIVNWFRQQKVVPSV